MAFTRFHDDPCRIAKQLQETTDLGRYQLNVPGNGDRPCYMADPFIRLQKWGGNLMTNTVNLESDLMGLTRSANRDYLNQNNYQKKAVDTIAQFYPTCTPGTDQSRATHPAWSRQGGVVVPRFRTGQLVYLTVGPARKHMYALSE